MASARSQWTRFTLRNGQGWRRSVRSSPRLQQEAIRWTYKLRNRSRWTQDQESRGRQAEEVIEALRSIGLKKAGDLSPQAKEEEADLRERLPAAALGGERARETEQNL